MRQRLMPFLLITFLLVLPVTLAAEEEKPTDFGTCQEPTFEITWTGYNDAKVVVKADPPQPLVVTLDYLEKSNKADPIHVRPIPPSHLDTLASDPACQAPSASSTSTTFCVAATDGAAVPLVLDRRPILKSSGLLSIRYKALEDDPDKLDAMCPSRRAGPADPTIRALDKHFLAFDVGLVYNLQGDGSWDDNAEAAFSARSRWFPFLLTGFDLRYSAIGADMPDDNGEEDGDNGQTMMDDEPEPFNPFASGGGILEGDIYAVLSLIPDVRRLGLVLGGGFSTVPGDIDDLETRQRYFAGFRLSVEGYNAGRPGDSLQSSKGFVQAGLAWDDLWKEVVLNADDDDADPMTSDESERIFLEGELQLPRIGSDWFRTAVRLDISVPVSGDGPSDIRVSVLGTIDPMKWFSGGNGGSK